MKAAVGLIVKLRSEKPTLVSAMEELCGAYIDLAYHDVTAYRKQRGPIKLPSSCPLTKLTRMREVAMPTIEIEVHVRSKQDGSWCQYRLQYNLVEDFIPLCPPTDKG